MPYKSQEDKRAYQRELMRKKRGTNKSTLDPVRPDGSSVLVADNPSDDKLTAKMSVAELRAAIHAIETKKETKKPPELTEERVREIAREEIIKFVNTYIVMYPL